ncbi:MAG: response regulator transcription factor [Anderseniella sp.]|nr:response regulator transcription factor [Anderseniella sp.]
MGYRIVLADDHPLFRDALRLTLQDALGDVSFDEAGSLNEVVELLASADDVDLVLLDLKMPGVQGFSGLALVRAQFPLIPVVVVSGSEDSSVIVRALSLGAAGFIPKSTPVPAMHTAVSAVLEGGEWIPEGIDPEATVDREADEIARRMSTLTPQQMRVLMMLREGLLNKQIAYELSVSEATIKAHVSAILQKLKVESRTQAVIAASRLDGDQADEGTGEYAV